MCRVIDQIKSTQFGPELIGMQSKQQGVKVVSQHIYHVGPYLVEMHKVEEGNKFEEFGNVEPMPEAKAYYRT